MAKLPAGPRRPMGGAPAAAAAQSDAVGKFDKFSTFALALPCTILALVCLVQAASYAQDHFGVSFFGIGAPTQQGWESGSDSINSTSAVQITGFESHDFIGRVSEGEVDVAVISAGSDQRVNLGDVFVLDAEQPDVRCEFVVFEVQSNFCRAYILLGQNVEGADKPRKYSLKRSEMVKLCGAEQDIRVKRPWRDQNVRRYVEARSTN